MNILKNKFASTILIALLTFSAFVLLVNPLIAQDDTEGHHNLLRGQHHHLQVSHQQLQSIVPPS